MTTLDIVELVFVSAVVICGFAGIIYVVLHDKKS